MIIYQFTKTPLDIAKESSHEQVVNFLTGLPDTLSVISSTSAPSTSSLSAPSTSKSIAPSTVLSTPSSTTPKSVLESSAEVVASTSLHVVPPSTASSAINPLTSVGKESSIALTTPPFLNTITRTEVSIWLQNNKYDNLCNYFKTHGATRLREFRDFFASYDINELCDEFPELTKLLLFTIKSRLTSLSDDDINSYK